MIIKGLARPVTGRVEGIGRGGGSVAPYYEINWDYAGDPNNDKIGQFILPMSLTFSDENRNVLYTQGDVGPTGVLFEVGYTRNGADYVITTITIAEGENYGVFTPFTYSNEADDILWIKCKVNDLGNYVLLGVMEGTINE